MTIMIIHRVIRRMIRSRSRSISRNSHSRRRSPINSSRSSRSSSTTSRRRRRRRRPPKTQVTTAFPACRVEDGRGGAHGRARYRDGRAAHRRRAGHTGHARAHVGTRCEHGERFNFARLEPRARTAHLSHGG